jgi:hypothetical protein
LQQAIDVLSKYELHRLAVSDHQNNFVSVITQFHLIKTLAKRVDEFPELGNMTVGDFALGFRDVVTIEDTELLMNAFVLIYQVS